MRNKKNKMEVPKLNLIPILDAVFIFIFFLLMSAQFLDVYEIKALLPQITSDTSSVDKSLQLKVKIESNQLILTTGTSEQIVYKGQFPLDAENKQKMMEILLKLKELFPNEKAAIILPSKKTKMNDIVLVIDLLREHHNKTLFNQITFTGNSE